MRKIPSIKLNFSALYFIRFTTYTLHLQSTVPDGPKPNLPMSCCVGNICGRSCCLVILEQRDKNPANQSVSFLHQIFHLPHISFCLLNMKISSNQSGERRIQLSLVGRTHLYLFVIQYRSQDSEIRISTPHNTLPGKTIFGLNQIVAFHTPATQEPQLISLRAKAKHILHVYQQIQEQHKKTIAKLSLN